MSETNDRAALVGDYRCDECEWSGSRPIREADGVVRCPSCASVAIIEPKRSDPPAPSEADAVRVLAARRLLKLED